MKSLAFIGGTLGFAGGVACSVIRKEPVLTCAWHGGLAAVLAGLLLPWWATAWSKKQEVASINDQSAPESLLSTSTSPKTSQS